jgi:hypothetical protein
MDRKHFYPGRRCMVLVLLAVSVTGAIGLGRIEPAGKNAGVIQFDAINELNNNAIAWDRGLYPANTVWFARYWVCQDYYAVSVVWTEPHGRGLSNVKTLAILSDKDGFRVNDDQFPFWVPLNTTYPKPLPERGPFAWLGGFYEVSEMRFAEAEALSRRVYADDLESLKSPGTSTGGVIDLEPGDNPGGVMRKLAQLKVRAKDGRVESMDLFDNKQQKLVGIEYEYDGAGDTPEISRLRADLPVRPEKLAIDVNSTITSGDSKILYRRTDVDYVYHKGGRTCTVKYEDVKAGSATLRLPVQVEVRRSDDKRLVRSAKLMNFKRADLDKAAIWEAAKAFGGFSSEDRNLNRISDKFLYYVPELGSLEVDPDDLAFARRLIAKYPTPEQLPTVEPGMNSQAREEQLAEWRKRIASTPKPKRMSVEPNDARVIRQLIRYYGREASGVTEEEREKMKTGQMHGKPAQTPTESQQELLQLQRELSQILRYHRAPVLPEDRTPEPNDLDLKLVRQLYRHYELLADSQNDTLGERLKVLDALGCLDLIAKDYDAFERRAAVYLQALCDANLPAMYMVGGYDGHINRLIDAGQFDRAKRLLRQWVDRSAMDNDADAVYRFCGSNSGGKGDPWLAVQLLDRFLKKPGLSPVERYEGLALRAIAFDRIDKLLARPQEDLEAKGGAINQVRWILSGTTRAQIARSVDPAVRQAVSAWQSLGTAKDNEARPYSTDEWNGDARERMGLYADATRLQETSAQLNRIVQQRLGRQGTAPRSTPTAPRSSGTRRSGTR